MGEPEREHTDVKRRKACMWMRGRQQIEDDIVIMCRQLATVRSTKRSTE